MPIMPNQPFIMPNEPIIMNPNPQLDMRPAGSLNIPRWEDTPMGRSTGFVGELNSNFIKFERSNLKNC